MTVEQRGIRIQLRIYETTDREDFIEMGKPFNISKQIVYEAYKRVKANKGSAGVDNVTIEDFVVQNLEQNEFRELLSSACQTGRNTEKVRG